MKITINNRSIEAREGERLIDAALRHGIEIPHFCYHPHLPVSGNCRMCLVKVENVPCLNLPNCLRLSNGQVEVVVTTDIGPRIVRYAFIGGENDSNPKYVRHERRETIEQAGFSVSAANRGAWKRPAVRTAS